MTVPIYLGREKTFPIFGTKNDSSYFGERGRMISAPTKKRVLLRRFAEFPSGFWGAWPDDPLPSL
jgi:hypothetical protein